MINDICRLFNVSLPKVIQAELYKVEQLDGNKYNCERYIYIYNQ